MPELPQELLIGFDAREDFLSHERLWPADRRSNYLLRSDVNKPLSMDPNVWPSLLNYGGGLPWSTLDAELAGFNGIDLPPTEVWENWPLFKDDAQLSSLIQHIWLRSDKRIQIVAISAVDEPRVSWPAGRLGGLPDCLKPLGYDIADGSISGLTNCGYDDQEKSSAVRKWASHLNENHLFTDVDVARCFRDWTDERVPEHAPFEVYGLYGVCVVPS